MRIILTDIEGTTTPLSFVHDCLFPYVLEHLDEYLSRMVSADYNGSDQQSLTVSYPLLGALKLQSDIDSTQKVFPSVPTVDPTSRSSLIQSVAANIRWQMAMDRKIAAVKNFQGYMWQEGYSAGKLKGIIYQDVAEALQRWKETGVDVYIYSSGSIQAQKLIFGYSDKGDLLPLIKGHFDTTIGGKLECHSYHRIAEQIGVDCGEILFLSDNPKELVAASKAGLKIALVIRPGNHPVDSETLGMFPTITSFHDINL